MRGRQRLPRLGGHFEGISVLLGDFLGEMVPKGMKRCGILGGVWKSSTPRSTGRCSFPDVLMSRRPQVGTST